MTVIAVFNQKGGVGKTTTALNLLAAIAQRGQRPLGIDLDPQAHLSHIFGVQPKLADDSVYSFFMRQRPLADIAQITRSGVVLCPAHLELAKLDSMLGKGVNVVTRLRARAARARTRRPARSSSTAARCSTCCRSTRCSPATCCWCRCPCDFLSLRGALQVERALNALEPVFKRRLPRRYLLTRYDVRRRMSDDGGRADGGGRCGRTRSA